MDMYKDKTDATNFIACVAALEVGSARSHLHLQRESRRYV